MPALVNKLDNASKQVEVWLIDETDFNECEEFLNKFYRHVKVVTKHYAFACNLDDGPKLIMKCYKCCPDQIDNAKKFQFSCVKQGFESRSDLSYDIKRTWQIDLCASIGTVDAPGVNPHKQVELWMNYAKLLDEDDAVLLCPEPKGAKGGVW